MLVFCQALKLVRAHFLLGDVETDAGGSLSVNGRVRNVIDALSMTNDINVILVNF